MSWAEIMIAIKRGIVASAESVANIISGATKVGNAANADKVNGFEAWQLRNTDTDGATINNYLYSQYTANTNAFHLKSSQSGISTSVDRANNSDTVDGHHASAFVKIDDVRLLSENAFSEKTDIRTIMYKYPSGTYTYSSGQIANLVTPFDDAVGMIIVWDRKYDATLNLYYGELSIRSMVTNDNWYACSIYNSISYTEWERVFTANGGTVKKLKLAREDNVTEGGQMVFEKPVQTAIAADISVDVQGNRFRIYESTSPHRGIGVDITTCSLVDSTEILHTSNSTKVVVSTTQPADTNAVWIVPN